MLYTALEVAFIVAGLCLILASFVRGLGYGPESLRDASVKRLPERIKAPRRERTRSLVAETFTKLDELESRLAHESQSTDLSPDLHTLAQSLQREALHKFCQDEFGKACDLTARAGFVVDELLRRTRHTNR